jgi:hypothetical protein
LLGKKRKVVNSITRGHSRPLKSLEEALMALDEDRGNPDLVVHKALQDVTCADLSHLSSPLASLASDPYLPCSFCTSSCAHCDPGLFPWLGCSSLSCVHGWLLCANQISNLHTVPALGALASIASSAFSFSQYRFIFFIALSSWHFLRFCIFVYNLSLPIWRVNAYYIDDGQ